MPTLKESYQLMVAKHVRRYTDIYVYIYSYQELSIYIRVYIREIYAGSIRVHRFRVYSKSSSSFARRFVACGRYWRVPA